MGSAVDERLVGGGPTQHVPNSIYNNMIESFWSAMRREPLDTRPWIR